MHCVCVKNACLESQVVPFVMHATRKSEDGQHNSQDFNYTDVLFSAM